MITDKDIYLDMTPVDLWRCGTDRDPTIAKIRTVPRPPLNRVDIQVDDTDKVYPNGGGISVFDNINPVLKRGYWWKIPRGTEIPHGLYIRRDAAHMGKDIVHYSICPAMSMPLSQFKSLLMLLSNKAHMEISAAEVARQ